MDGPESLAQAKELMGKEYNLLSQEVERAKVLALISIAESLEELRANGRRARS